MYAARLNDLACLRGERGDVGEAGRLMLKCMETHASGLDLSSLHPTGFELDPYSASVQTLMLSRFLAICTDPGAKLAGDEVYAQAVLWKGSYLARELRGRRWRNQPRFAPLFDRLEKVAAELAQAVVAAPAPDDLPAWDRIRSLTATKDDLEHELTRALVKVDPGSKQERPQIDRLKSLLPRDAALVDFRIFMPWKGWGHERPNDQRVLAFVVRPDRPVVILDLGPFAPIRQAIGEWRDRVQKIQDPSRPAGRLEELLWKPLAPCLADVHTLLVSPDGELCLFPMAALPGERPGSYLVEAMAVATVPVPQLLVTGVPFDPAPPSLVVLGGVDFDAPPGERLTSSDRASARRGATGPSFRSLLPKFTPLPGTARELEMVRDRFAAANPGSPVTVLRGSGATEQAFRRSLEHPRFIHLATHGFSIPPEAAARGFGRGDGQDYWTSNPAGLSRIHPGLLSGILMAGSNRPAQVDRDDGVLTAVEAQHLDLAGTDLVVLSACESAVGTSTRGEGLMGLQRAFQAAGARSLVSSLWSVEDNATAALMDEFYANLWTRGLPRLEALRQAQLTLIRRFDPRRLVLRPAAEPQPKAQAPLHPIFWAGFTLSGDWQ